MNKLSVALFFLFLMCSYVEADGQSIHLNSLAYKNSHEGDFTIAENNYSQSKKHSNYSLVDSFNGVDNSQSEDRSNFFIGYETLEMVMNKFQNFAGEVGYRFDDKKQIRLMIGEVKLTERHLSSKWEAAAVDGDNVEGYFRIYELYYDRYFGKRKNWYYSGSTAYVRDKYNHLISDQSIDNKTGTIGLSIGYKNENLFGVKHLYINAAIPVRYYFNDIPEAQWGDTKVLPHKIVNNLWLFVGYHF